MPVTIVIALVAFLLGAGAAGLIVFFQRRAETRQASSDAAKILAGARRESEKLLTDAEVRAKEKLLAQEQEQERAWKAKRKELAKLESDLEAEEQRQGKAAQQLQQRVHEAADREKKLAAREEQVEKEAREVEDALAIHRARLEQIAGLSAADAKAELMRQMEFDARRDATRIIKKVEENARDRSKNLARIILLQAVEKVGAYLPLEGVVSVVKLPSEEMKGRVIGREGRNIRAFERITGVDVIVDDTPEIIMLACHNPVRREVGRLTLEKLVEDGRIHPARIEEMAQKCHETVEAALLEQGKEALFHLGVLTMHERLAALVGRMKVRTAGGQSLLEHSVEVAKIAAYMGQCLGIPVEPLKRAAILHEVGHVEEHLDDTHPVLLAAQLARQFGESPTVVSAISHLHPDHPSPLPEAHLLEVAEHLALSVPGIHKEGLERHVEHLEHVEKLVMGMKGPEKVYAMKAGRELLVMVDPKNVDDEATIWLAKDIAERLEREVRFTGTIKVQVIRETRSVDYAT